MSAHGIMSMQGPGVAATTPGMDNTCMRGAVMADATCSIPGCDLPASGRGWCQPHYMRWHRHGDTDPTRPLRSAARAPAPVRFWAKVDRRGADECWAWQAFRDRDGYGMFTPTVPGKSYRAHRYAYEQMVGAIPDGLQLDHLCRNRGCVNPAHLEPVTVAENLFRSPIAPAAVNAAKTHCRHGHVLPVRTGPGERFCAECRTGANTRYRAKRRAEGER